MTSSKWEKRAAVLLLYSFFFFVLEEKKIQMQFLQAFSFKCLHFY